MSRLVLTVSALTVALAACAPAIESGTVIARGYSDPYVEQVFLCTAYNANGTCMVWTPYDSHIPECWRITYADGEHEASVCVGRSTWDGITVGDHFDVTAVEVAS